MTQRSVPAPPDTQGDKIHTLQLAYYDDAISVRDKLQFAQTRRVLLVMPQQAEGRVFKGQVDLLLVQREAARRQIRLALVTDNPDLIEHAQDLNISVFNSIRQARTRRWKRPRNQRFTERPRGVGYDNPYALMPIVSRLRARRQGRTRLLGRGLLALLMFLVLGGSVLAIVPSATVTITPARDQINEQFLFSADPQASEMDVINGVLPAQVTSFVTNNVSVTVEATGIRDAADSLAQGSVTFTNETDSPIFIPAGTVVRSSGINAQRYQTRSDLALAAQVGASAQVDIIALTDSAGLDGNVGADAIILVEGALDAQVSVRNEDPTFGGGLVQEGVVTVDDHARLQELARQAIVQNAQSELLLQLPAQQQLLLPQSVQIVEERPEWTIYSAEVGDAAESVTLSMRALVEAQFINELQAQQLAFLSLSRRLPSAREINESSLEYTYELQGLDAEGHTQLLLLVEGSSTYAIDEQALARRLRGMGISEARRSLESELLLDPANPPEIRLFPFSIGRMPLLPIRIEVRVRRP